ncbi:alpha/beta fold hydrolase [Allomuricauda sp. d1]|uniref:alpha/beta fold hydrolase n=1 Tax=Allomuricauda sp. d1 TaxID=3136725 RepID=UPI0031E415C2
MVLHSTILGSGKPMIILHGFLGMLDNWKTLGKQYAENGLEVHLVDQRNHGKSFHSKDFDYELLANDVKNYMAFHGLDSAMVLGHSMGGKTAMQFAVSHPEMVDKLLVADIAPKHYPPHHQDIVDALESLDFSKIQSRGEADEKLAEKLADFGIRQFLLKNLYWVEKGTLGFRFNLDVLKDKMEEIGEDIPPSSPFTKPTLFLRGDRSEYIAPSDSELIKKRFPNASIATIENAGHWLHAENPKQFFEKTMDFINR